MTRKTGIEILSATFTDHCAVVGEPGSRRCRVRWKLDPNMLRDADLLSQLRQQWNKWKMRKPWYPNVNIWWDRYVMRQLQQYLRKWGAYHRRDRARGNGRPPITLYLLHTTKRHPMTENVPRYTGTDQNWSVSKPDGRNDYGFKLTRTT